MYVLVASGDANDSIALEAKTHEDALNESLEKLNYRVVERKGQYYSVSELDGNVEQELTAKSAAAAVKEAIHLLNCQILWRKA